MTHICDICHREFGEHDECHLDHEHGDRVIRFVGQEECCAHWPPLCCPGCGCLSFEEAHPEASAE